MDIVFYGFLIGIGIVLAVALVAVIIGMILMIGMFASYMRERGKNVKKSSKE